MRQLLWCLCLSTLAFISKDPSPKAMLYEAETLTQQGHYWEAISLLEKILKDSLSVADTTLAQIHHHLGINYFRLGDDKKAIYYWELELKRIDDNLKISKVLRNLGSSYRYLGDLAQAEKTLLRSLSIYLSGHQQDSTLLGNIHRNLGQVYTDLQDRKRASEYFKQAEAIFRQSSENRRFLSSLYTDMIKFFWQDNYLDSALIYALRSLENFPVLPDKSLADTFNLADRYHDIGLAFFSMDSITLAFDYNERSLLINQRYPSLREEALAKNFNNLSLLYLGNKNYRKAEEFVLKAIYLNKKRKNNYLLATNYNSWAEIYLSAGQLHDALRTINQSIQFLVPKFSFTDVLENPFIHNPDVVIGDRVEMARSLADKARILTALATRQDASYFPAAIATYQTVTQLFNDIRANFGAVQSKRAYTANVREILAQALQTNWTAYQHFRQDTTYLNNILSLMEQSRAVSLLDELHRVQAKVLAGIPDSLLAREEALRQEIQRLENRSFEGAGNLSDSLIQKRQELDRFQQDTLSQYPRYVQLKIPPLVSLSTLQQELLHPDQALLQYFLADTILYCLYVDQQDVQVYARPLEVNLPSLVAQLDSLLTNEASTVEAFQPVAQQLYEILLQPPLEHFQNKQVIHRLQIIPDGVLAKVPFSVLPGQPLDQEASFYSFPYLLRRYAISYAYSASVLQLQKNHTGFKDYLVGAFAVKDYEKYGNLANLSAQDAQIAYEMLSGQLVENATLAEFKALAPKYPILHLSLHAFGDDQQALQSHLVFHDTTLRAADIYSMTLPAALAVLSGCETGKGQLQRGEGVMSLAHAFAYAEVSAMILSLWKLQDLPATVLFSTFYEKLADEQLPKDVALQQAKLALIATQPQFHHPYYWALLVSSGDQSALPIAVQKSSIWKVITAGFILLLVISLVIRFSWRPLKAA